MRRHLLVVAALFALVLLAGCSAAGSISMDPVSNDELTEQASRNISATDVEPDAESRMILSAVRNGSATLESRYPPVEAGLPFAYHGAYYNLSWTVTEQRHATAVNLEIDYNASNVSGDRIAYADLPAPDQRAVDSLLPPRDDRQTDGYDFGVGVTYTDAESEQSVLVPTQQYDAVVYEGEVYPIRVSDSREVTLNTYRYTSTLVANDSEAYAQQLKDEYLFTLSNLSEAERNVVSSAIEDRYYAESDEDSAFRAVLERFHAHDAVQRDETYGSWIVRYDDTVYWADLSYGQFTDEM